MADDWGRAGSQVLTPLSSISSSKALQRSQGEGTLPAANGRARRDQGAASDRRSDVATSWEQSTLVWQGRDADSSPTHHEEDYLGCRFRPELTFTSFGRHGGTTEASTSGLTETQLMKKGQWSST